MAYWRRRLDWSVMTAGGIVAHAGVFTQAAGFAVAFLFGDPLTGYQLLMGGFWVAGLGGAGLAYGMTVEAGGSREHPWDPVTYHPPRRRWPAALLAVLGTPLWAVLSLPAGILLYGVLVVGLCTIGGLRAFHLARRCLNSIHQ
jgi:hypothetical protein